VAYPHSIWWFMKLNRSGWRRTFKANGIICGILMSGSSWSLRHSVATKAVIITLLSTSVSVSCTDVGCSECMSWCCVFDWRHFDHVTRVYVKARPDICYSNCLQCFVFRATDRRRCKLHGDFCVDIVLTFIQAAGVCVYSVLVGKPEVKRTLGRPRRR
jgi:hypothetical protein